MIENNKMKVIEEHCKRLVEQLQRIDQELRESMADQKNKWQ